MISVLSELSVSENPFIQFDIWYRDHLSKVTDIPEAAFLATASPDGRVSVRTILLKEYSMIGFTFFTNYNSRKSSDLARNSSAALLFYWKDQGRQVRIEGSTEKISGELSDVYFETRPRESQLSAWASDQSSVVPDRNYLENRFSYFAGLYAGSQIPRPANWGGYFIKPDTFEFWENREHRLHDRIEYRKKGDAWKISRLAP